MPPAARHGSCGAGAERDASLRLRAPANASPAINPTLVAVVAVALFFDFTNGFHDAGNAVATSVSTRALSPRLAILLAAGCNFLGAFLSIKVATTVGTGIVDPSAVTLKVVLAGVVGAVGWNLTTWFFGLPTSSSHALIGGVTGSAVAANGWRVVNGHGFYRRVLVPSLAAPVLGVLVAFALVLGIMWAFRGRRYRQTQSVFRRLQVISAGLVALSHGTNDAQKTMGVIALALVAAHPSREFHVPVWVIASAAAAMAAGTYAGGWRIMRTLSQRVTHLDSHQGFAAETATAGILFTAAHLGFPVSTTHTISGSIVGAGAAKRLSAVRWGIARNILAAWLLTIPAAAGFAAFFEQVTSWPGGEAIVLGAAVAMAAVAVLIAAGVIGGLHSSYGRSAVRGAAPTAA